MIFKPTERFIAYVVFMGAEHRRPWRIFTRRGWRHVFVCLPIYDTSMGYGLNAQEFTVILDPRTNCLQHSVAFMPAREAAHHFSKMGATCVIRMPVSRKGIPWFIPRGVQNCVSVVKSVLGVGAWYVLTPEHLARWLVRNGGQIITKGK